MEFDAGRYDIAVIGAGHAGIEAGLACARMGLETVVFTINLDAVGNMPCNPAIGGTGKGHLVRELDALGGEMAKAADRSCIQYRMLNLGKGPAVHSLRAQADRRRYQEDMKRTLERQEHLDLKQAMVTQLRLTDGHVSAVVTRLGAVYSVKACVIASGTYLDARVITGQLSRRSYNPGTGLPTAPVWALSRSLAATWEIVLTFFSYGYLDVSVPHVRFLDSKDDGIASAGFPHSDIHGSMGICPSPWLFAACHVLLRLREPRHPPCALLVPLFVSRSLRLLVSFALPLLSVSFVPLLAFLLCSVHPDAALVVFYSLCLLAVFFVFTASPVCQCPRF